MGRTLFGPSHPVTLVWCDWLHCVAGGRCSRFDVHWAQCLDYVAPAPTNYTTSDPRISSSQVGRAWGRVACVTRNPQAEAESR